METLNYKGDDYIIINQMGERITFTVAYRMVGFNTLRILTENNYKNLGVKEFECILLSTDELKKILSHQEQMEELVEI